jgi:hypothetical protein
VGDVGPDAQVYHWTAAVHSGRCAIWNFGLDEILLIFIILSINEYEQGWRTGQGMVLFNPRGTFQAIFP